MNSQLYIVATPIGNLEDITFRALDVLRQVEVIVCEDTRQTQKLLTRYEVKKKLISLHQHSSEKKIESLINNYLAQGLDLAYVSDAGTPGISDPGNKFVAQVAKAGFKIEPIPGPCALITALSVSGFLTDKFLFLGFMPHKGRDKIFNLIKAAKFTVVFYDSCHRILKTLEQLKSYLDEKRQIMVARELTKKFETIYRGNVSQVLKQVEKMPKGEFVIVVSK